MPRPFQPPIPSPYNFVPLNRKVLLPDWANQIRLDVPFSDAISGSFAIEIEAKTPIFVRGPGKHPSTPEEKAATEEHWQFFRLPDGRYALPGTTIKGMAKAVLEIVTFGLFAPRIDDTRHSIRDLNHSKYRGFMTKGNKNKGFESRVNAGWLRRDSNNRWYIEPCRFARVNQGNLEAMAPNSNPVRLNCRQSAKNKYDSWKDAGLSTDVWFQFLENFTHDCQSHRGTKIIINKVTSIGCSQRDGDTRGRIVFTGQPNGSKHMEFVFFPPPAAPPFSPARSEDQQTSFEKTFCEFERIHSKENTGQDDEQGWPWGFWRDAYHEGRTTAIPVFYLGSASAPDSIGLAMMYRLPLATSLRKAGAQESLRGSEAPEHGDFADMIFGMAASDEDSGLKGRVHFEPAPSIMKEVEPLPKVATVLASPKPTYYPNYIQQRPRENKWDKAGSIVRDEANRPRYTTLMDPDARLRGWKRYPVREDGNVPTPPEPPSERMAVHFCPLPCGVKFKGVVRIHNLRPIELGALLWVLEWGGDEGLRHSLGMAKAYGFGSVRVTVTRLEGLRHVNPSSRSEPIPSKRGLQEGFRDYMEKELPGWGECAQLASICAMANPKFPPPHPWDYPRLEPNDFVEAKKHGHGVALVPYVDIVDADESVAEGSGTGPEAVGKLRFRYLGRFKKGKPDADGNPKFKLEDGKATDIGYLQDPADRERFPADVEPGKWVGEFVVKSNSPGNWCLTWPPGTPGTAPKS